MTLPWITLLNRWPPADEILREVADLVKNDLEGHFGDAVVFDPIIIPKIDHDEEEYLHIYVVFDGKFDPLETRWTRGLYFRIQSRLLEMGIIHYTSESYIEKSRWDKIGDRILKKAEANLRRINPEYKKGAPTELPWISLLYRWPPSDEILREAAELVKNDLEGHFGDTVVFDPIVVVPKIDHDDVEYLYIYVVFDGKIDPLEIRWTDGLYFRIQWRLRDMGIMSHTSESYVEKSRWDKIGDRILKRAKTKLIL